MVPILGRQRRHAEGLAGRVEPVPSRRIDGVTVGLLQVHDPRFVVDDGARRAAVVAVDVINPVARIQAVVGRDGRADVGDAGRPAAVHLVVKHFVLVEMRVAEKLAGYRRLVPTDLKRKITDLSKLEFNWN